MRLIKNCLIFCLVFVCFVQLGRGFMNNSYYLVSSLRQLDDINKSQVSLKVENNLLIRKIEKRSEKLPVAIQGHIASRVKNIMN